MSKFSDRCKSILVENGTNVYRLSTNSNLERTTLQRMVTGKRLPSMEFVDLFCETLRLSDIEKDELLELYKIEVIGEDAYRREQSILNLLRVLSEAECENSETSNKPLAYIDYSNISLSTNIASNIEDTRILLNYVLTTEFASNKSGTIYANLPADDLSFLSSIDLFSKQYKSKIKLKHLLHFQTNISLTTENLHSLTLTLPFYLASSVDYQVYYYYSRITNTDQAHMLFPYYIITSQHVLLISENNQNGVLIADRTTVKQYIARFKEVLALAKPLFHKISLLNQFWEIYHNNRAKTQPSIQCLHYQPCYVSITGGETFLKKAHSSLKAFYSIGEKYISLIKNNSSDSHDAYYTDAGFEDFAKTGKYYGQIGVFFPSMEPDERRECIQYFLQHNDFYTHHMLRSTQISLPKNLYFELNGTKLLQIMRIKSITEYDFITIEESSICEAFYGFFENLSSSKAVYTPEEAKAFMVRKMHEHLPLTPPKK